MKTLATTALIVSLGLVQSAGANLLEDGSFDLSDTGTVTSNSAWDLTANKPDKANLSAFFKESPISSNDGGVPPEKGVSFNAFEGNEGTDDPFAEALLRQEVLGAGAGDYVLNFDYKITQYFNAIWTVTLDSDLNFGAPVVFDIGANGVRDGAWHTEQLQLNGLGPGASLLVEVKMLNGEYSVTIPHGDQTGYVDNFVLVPEPGSLAMLSLGGLLIARRRRL